MLHGALEEVVIVKRNMEENIEQIISYVCIESKYYKIKWNVQRHKLVNQQAIMKSF